MDIGKIEVITDENSNEEKKIGSINEQDKIVSEKSEEKTNILEEDKGKNHEKPPFISKMKEKVISFMKDNYNLAFLVILLLAFLIRLKYIGQESIWNDAAQHLWYAIKVTKEPLFFFSKEYIFDDYFVIQTLTAFVYLFTKNAFIAGKIIAMFFGLVGIIFIYLLGSELKNKTTGLIAAALLAFHQFFWFFGIRSLADAPLTVIIIVLLFCLIKLNKKPTLFWSITTSTIFFVAFFIKKQSILFLISLLIFYIIFERKRMFKDKSLLLSWLLPIIVIMLGNIIYYFMFGGILIERLFVTMFRFTALGDSSSALSTFSSSLMTWYLLPLLVLGLILILVYKEKRMWLVAITLIFYYLFFEFNITPLPRYLLPLVPLGILIASYALDEAGNFISMFTKHKLKYVLIFIFVLIVVLNFYSQGTELIENKSNSYAGHGEAGEWIKANVPEDAIIFAGAPRIVCAFIEREYAGPDEWNKGGNSLWNLRAGKYLENKTAFENDLNLLSRKHDVYLEIDIWEYTQPKWYFPINQDSLNYFASLGFELLYVVEREVNTQQGKQKMPVIFIMKLNKNNQTSS